jgi:anti-sigma B factor antagonist
MNAQISIRRSGDTAVVVAEGRLTLGPGTDAIRQAVQELAVEGCKQVVLNLHRVTVLDSSAVGELVAAYDVISTYGGEIKLASINRRVDDILTIARLNMMFDIFKDEADAVGSFQRPQSPAHVRSPETFVG